MVVFAAVAAIGVIVALGAFGVALRGHMRRLAGARDDATRTTAELAARLDGLLAHVGELNRDLRQDLAIARNEQANAAGSLRTEVGDRLAQFTQSQGKTLAQLLDAFAAAREESLRQLAALGLKDADLDRRGRHPDFGAVTLRQLLATWVALDFDHLMQISRVLARQYADEVGPWRAYLRIIRDPVQG